MAREDSLWHGIFFMGFGTVMAQLVNVLSQPILTRLVSSDVLGIYTYIVSMATLVIPVASLKMDMLVVTEEKEDEAQYITDVCVVINIAISILYLIVISFGYCFFDNSIFNKYGVIIFIVPVLVFFNGLRFLFISYNNRYKKYKLISFVAIVREMARALFQVVSGFITGGVLGQALGYALSPLLGLNLQTKDYIRKMKQRSRLTLSHFKSIMLKGREQIIYLVPAQFINGFSGSLVTISITALFSASALGYYSAGVRVLDVPIIFITSNVSKVCYQRVSEYVKDRKPVLQMIISVMFVLIIVSALGFGLLYIVAPKLTEWFFGEGYAESGEYIRCLCIMYGIRFVATSFAGMYTVFGKQHFELILNIALICVAAVSFRLAGVEKMSMNGYLWVIGMGYTVVYAIMLIGYVFLCYKHDKMVNGIN